MFHKNIILMAALFLLAACGSSQPNLIHSQQPILNIEAPVQHLVTVELTQNQAKLRNQTAQPLKLKYAIFWYDQYGVTSTLDTPIPWQQLTLPPQQKLLLPLSPPNAYSVNYRFYVAAP